MTPLSESSILVVGLARDCEKYLSGSIECLVKTFGAAKSIAFLIVESDSSDNTVNLLSYEASIRLDFRYVALGDLRKRIPLRTERIAFCRNYYLNLIRKSSDYRYVDYVVVADLDGVNSSLTASAVASCWSRGNWDVCTANQLGNYYDIWALRHPLWSPNDCWAQSRFLMTSGSSRFTAIFSSVLIRMINIAPSDDWINVESAFGGLAIYRKCILDGGGFYKGLDDSGVEVCEHVSLHEHICHMGGKIFINPNLTNTAPLEHVRYLKLRGLIVLWAKSFAKDLLFKLRSLMPRRF